MNNLHVVIRDAMVIGIKTTMYDKKASNKLMVLKDMESIPLSVPDEKLKEVTELPSGLMLDFSVQICLYRDKQGGYLRYVSMFAGEANAAPKKASK